MRKSPKYSPEVQERAVRMVFDAKHQYPSQWAAIGSIAGKIGCTGETPRKWVASSAYRRHAARCRHPALLPARAKRDALLLPEVQRVFDQNLQVYGADKVWRQLQRFVDPADVAALAVLLASDAGRSISGQLLPVDGDSQGAA
jgi:transposase-like protein